ncbi:2-phosphosulfolactate phosphatase [Streptomyces sp. NPDC050085]|uniref:2-phosphosulfolactate phosphatase n=1 Tax=Streptomyces sp. NPDC050085 TaxID=3365600 RepID=UPI0037A3276B
MSGQGAAWASQSSYGVRFEWGRAGAAALAPQAACLVVVDVLSFTTAVSVAVERGILVHPYPWRDASARAYADSVGAQLAVGRAEMSDAEPWSLSASALRSAPHTDRLVLPSPNGSTIAAAAPDGVPVVAACLRNAGAVGAWLEGEGFGTPDRPLAVIAAGEQWPGGVLRPALEDLLGAGAVLTALGAGGARSPEALMAAACFAAAPDVAATVRDCASGRQLHAYGFDQDVAVAAELDSTDVVPVLRDGAFRPVTRPRPRPGSPGSPGTPGGAPGAATTD